MNRLYRWKWLVLSAALVALPFTAPTQAAGVSVSQGSSASLGQAELEQMLAPIALYPDSLLSHILIASTYPLEVVQAQRWLEDHPKLSVDQVMSRTEDKDWDPSVKALMAFPNVLQKMSEDLDWTQRLGEAFLADEAQVMDGIQSLRQQADKANNLANMDNMAITRANNLIIIEPARREVVYVPYYDPRVVYGTWRWGVAYPPVYWEFGGYVGYPYRPSNSYFYWSPGIHISFNYFFSSFHWHNHRVVVIDHHHSHHYRPRERYSVSYGAQPWKHKPEHRRGVVYHNPVVKQRYYSDSKLRGRDSHSSGSGQHFTSQYAKSREQQNVGYQRDNKGYDKSHSKDRGYNYSRERAPNFQNTQAELKERRSVPMNSVQAKKEGYPKERNDNGRHDNQVRQMQAKASREQTKDSPQRQYQSRDSQPRNLEIRAQPQRQETRPEVRRAEPQHSEQPRQSAPRQAAPKQREEVRVRQNEPRQNMQTARNVEHNQGRSAQSQERRHRE
ncbi:DUF3300 domain-containing protein [Shewanella sp. CG12_big_fil_rev_8_21_14_0_65_47_15]|uniref:DUF3300 domain-containing protein n=1 Tax=Shewanella sp. CG12_big_fil_rev_8_21_14_0_65_47_15 TaxID=1975537 RepID=UPI000CAA83DA|nr:DUF3300 domain-containing protein [Shewanella sp. CG12_big_fil_rev_8_21_14_0_65_47_15]PIW63033.1 MAG: DUF3300 domain-containing protein [Shewanella sp. CG12_big_fil_rev_8_21_14_0_65_47_15]